MIPSPCMIKLLIFLEEEFRNQNISYKTITDKAMIKFGQEGALFSNLSLHFEVTEEHSTATSHYSKLLIFIIGTFLKLRFNEKAKIENLKTKLKSRRKQNNKNTLFMNS